MNGRVALLKGNFIMPTTDIYARTNLTRSGQPNTRFQVIIKISKATFEELRQLPENRDQTDNQLLSKVSGRITSLLRMWQAEKLFRRGARTLSQDLDRHFERLPLLASAGFCKGLRISMLKNCRQTARWVRPL
jgi:hypothetical protein